MPLSETEVTFSKPVQRITPYKLSIAIGAPSDFSGSISTCGFVIGISLLAGVTQCTSAAVRKAMLAHRQLNLVRGNGSLLLSLV